MTQAEATPDWSKQASGERSDSELPALYVTAHSGQLGGAELGLLRYLSGDIPFRVTCLVFEDGPLVRRLRASGVTVRIAPSSGTLATLRFLRRALPKAGGLVWSTTLRSATLTALVVPRNCAHVYYVQDLIDGGYFSFPKRFLAKQLTLPRCDYLVANSKATLASLPPKAQQKCVATVYSPSGVHQSDLDSPVESPSSPGQPLRLLNLGRVAPWKGTYLFVSASEHLHRLRPEALGVALVAGGSFFGEEKYRRLIEKRIVASHAPINMLGHQNDIASLFAESDVLVLSSLTPEPFGQVIVQGMAHGLLVVAPRVGGPLEILEDRTSGYFYDPGDLDSLLRTLIHIWENPAERTKVSTGARLAAGNFTDARIADRISGALTDIHARFAGNLDELRS